MAPMYCTLWSSSFQATDRTLVQRLHEQHEKNPDYLKPRFDKSLVFGIRHFAGDVFYETKGFLEKNKDTFSGDLLALMPTTKNKFLHSLFIEDLKNAGKEQNNKKTFTLSSQFKKSLDLLMATLGACNPFFIRCIKPNEFKRPLVRKLIIITAKQHTVCSDVWPRVKL